MVVEYLARADREQPALDALRASRQVGATAMAPALRDFAELEPVPVVASPVGAATGRS
ncbi:MAG: hypothetical protein AB7L91_19430 [Dehalococcoidia bacterium]